MLDSEKIIQQLQEAQHLSSTLQSELLSIQEDLSLLSQKGKERKAGKLVTVRLIQK